MRNREPWILRHHMRVYRQYSFRIRLYPCHLKVDKFYTKVRIFGSERAHSMWMGSVQTFLYNSIYGICRVERVRCANAAGLERVDTR